MKRACAVFLLLLAGAMPAAAAPIVFTTLLSGSAEDPPNASPGIGEATVTIDANTMQVEVSFSGLLGTTSASHIHIVNGPGDPNPADTNGPVATTVPTFPGFPLGVMAGSYDMSFDMTQASSYNPGFLNHASIGGSTATAQQVLFAAIMDGTAYLNIHSMGEFGFPAGEIRGFLQPEQAPVPEPSSLALLGIAVAGSLARRYRRRA